MGKNIFVISYFSNMPGVCQAEWVDDRISAFVKRGYKLLLFSSLCSFKSKDSSVSHIRIPSFTPHSFTFEYDQIIEKKILFSNLKMNLFKWYYLITRLIYKIMCSIGLRTGEARWGWMISAFIYSLRYIGRIRKSEFIYTTGGPPGGHLIAIVIGKILGIKVICELQDPLTGDDIGRNKFSKLGFQIVEKLIIKYATNTIFCTQNASVVAKSKYKKYSKKINFVYPGAFPVEIEKISKFSNGNIMKVIYLGSLYQTRNFDTLMLALRSLSNDFDLAGRIQIDIYGNMDNDIRNRIDQFEFPIIHKHGLVSRQEAMKSAKESDVLLLIQNSDLRSSVTIPFKIYDYLNLKIPILGLIYKNSELESILTEHGHLACQVDDINQIKAAILQYLTNYEHFYSNIIESKLTPDLAAIQMINIVNGNDIY